MLNFNGEIISAKELQLSNDNRAFKYGDGVFETLKIYASKIVFLPRLLFLKPGVSGFYRWCFCIRQLHFCSR